jgi:hypothetical protein
MTTDEKSLIDRAKGVIHSGLDIRELIRFYNFYSDNSFWESIGLRQDTGWYETCLILVKQELARRGIVATERFQTLPEIPNFQPAPGLLISVNVKENKFEIIRDEYDLEEDLNRSEEIKELVKDQNMATELYGSLCNVDWYKDGIRWSCSWRYAGGIVADLRNVGEEYIDFYCSGNEGLVHPIIEEKIRKLGWTPKTT